MPKPVGPPGPGIAKPAATGPVGGPPVQAASPRPPAPAAAGESKQPRPPASFLTKAIPAWLVSMLVHVIVLLSMALVATEVPRQESPRLIQASAPAVDEQLQDFVEESLPVEQPAIDQQVVTDAVVMPDSSSVSVETVQVVSEANDPTAAALTVELTDFGSETVAPTDLLSKVGLVGGQAAGGLGGRVNTQMRNRLIQTGGGTDESEKAVEAALKWFIRHQLPNGSWSLDLTLCPNCQGQCSHGASAKSYPLAGPTALALLPFLGRGYTHRDGPYKHQIELALNALATKVVLGKGNAGEGSYVQGLVGICLSESYAMTKDPRLGMPAQLAVAYVAASQDPVGGGWGYGYRSQGDTSILGWNLMALKSGYLASLPVDPLVVRRSVDFLNSVQADDGAAYGYREPAMDRLPLTAAALLCRMYLGWKKDHPALNRGADRIAKAGPNADLYYDYYATQVLHHLEGDRWKSWNDRMRELLVTTQAKSGHEAGSWFDGVNGGHGAEAAGRIFCTSLATMILEVYYRHLPLYGQESVDEFKE